MCQAEVRILDAVGPQGDGLRVEFFRIGRRWAHRLCGVEQYRSRPLLQSVEGDEHQSFPPSPALQQLELQQHAGLSVALLIGMAGSNHWSLGVEAFPESGRVRLDVACRNQPGGRGHLGSTYQMLLPWHVRETDRPVAVTEGFRYRLVPQPVNQAADMAVTGPPSDPLVLRVTVDPSCAHNVGATRSSRCPIDALDFAMPDRENASGVRRNVVCRSAAFCGTGVPPNTLPHAVRCH